MRITKLLLASCFYLSLTSCCEKVYYQVYKTEHPNMESHANTVTYENDDCKVLYNLWGSQGNAGFGFYNKTDKDIYIILPRTFYIMNGVAHDYFKNREYHSNKSVNTSSSNSKSSVANANLYGIVNTWVGYYYGSVGKSIGYNETSGISVTNNSGISVKESPIICIPPKSIKFIAEYSVLSSPIRICGKNQEFPKKQSAPVSYTKEDSPINFKNKITYSFDSEGKEAHEIENEFWISELINYNKKEIIKSEFKKACPEDINETVLYNKEKKADRFFNTYMYKKRPKGGKFVKYNSKDDIY